MTKPAAPKLLAIDSSTKRFSLAVADGEKILKSRNLVLDKVLSSSIVPAIRKILRDAGLGLPDMDGFAVGLGPGSFTSLRVGLATVKGLAFAAQKPVVGIPSPDVVAEHAAAVMEDCHICVLSDAKRNLVYTCLYEIRDGRAERKSDYVLTGIEDVLAKIQADTVFVGDAIPLFRGTIEEKGRDWRPAFADEKFWLPEAKYLVPLSLEKFRKKKTDNIDKLTPLYLYPADCQVSSKR